MADKMITVGSLYNNSHLKDTPSSDILNMCPTKSWFNSHKNDLRYYKDNAYTNNYNLFPISEVGIYHLSYLLGNSTDNVTFDCRKNGGWQSLGYVMQYYVKEDGTRDASVASTNKVPTSAWTDSPTIVKITKDTSGWGFQGLNEGTANVYAKYNDVTAQNHAVITVSPPNYYTLIINVTPSSANITFGAKDSTNGSVITNSNDGVTVAESTSNSVSYVSKGVYSKTTLIITYTITASGYNTITGSETVTVGTPTTITKTMTATQTVSYDSDTYTVDVWQTAGQWVLGSFKAKSPTTIGTNSFYVTGIFVGSTSSLPNGGSVTTSSYSYNTYTNPTNLSQGVTSQTLAAKTTTINASTTKSTTSSMIANLYGVTYLLGPSPTIILSSNKSLITSHNP